MLGFFKRLAFGAKWNSFNGTEEDFPAFVSMSGIPIKFEVKTNDGIVHPASLVGLLTPPQAFRSWNTGHNIPTDQVTAWRWSREEVWRIRPSWLF